jgi:hypothetical protein
MLRMLLVAAGLRVAFSASRLNVPDAADRAFGAATAAAVPLGPWILIIARVLVRHPIPRARMVNGR